MLFVHVPWLSLNHVLFEFLLLIANKELPAGWRAAPDHRLRVVAWACRLTHVFKLAPPRLSILLCLGHDIPGDGYSLTMLLHIPLISRNLSAPRRLFLLPWLHAGQ
jgi:hypothetical protein